MIRPIFGLVLLYSSPISSERVTSPVDPGGVAVLRNASRGLPLSTTGHEALPIPGGVPVRSFFLAGIFLCVCVRVYRSVSSAVCDFIGNTPVSSVDGISSPLALFPSHFLLCFSAPLFALRPPPTLMICSFVFHTHPVLFAAVLLCSARHCAVLTFKRALCSLARTANPPQKTHTKS